MQKTVTLRLNDETYARFAAAAKADNRSLANLVETYALRELDRIEYVDDVEMQEILADKDLLQRLEEGRAQGRRREGSFVE